VQCHNNSESPFINRYYKL